MLLRFVVFIVACYTVSISFFAQETKSVKNALSSYFTHYTNYAYTSNDKIAIENITVDSESQTLNVYVNEGFASQPFTPDLVKNIYNSVRSRLQAPFDAYNLTIYAQGFPIESLVPLHLQETPDSSRYYQKRMFKGNPWVTPVSQPYKLNNVLNGAHLCAWSSHGKYYRNSAKEWVWQRPYLYCTTEDLLTQTIVLPYLIPMLQNAGAVVYTPRERDWQKSELVVDNDTPQTDGLYSEVNDKYSWEDAGMGFAHIRPYYNDHQNPFEDGTCRMIDATSNGKQLSTSLWQPNISEEGEYAVYVSYKTMPNSIPDAVYTVRHQGIATSFRVNQQMGGGTWVYLGTFRFSAGCSIENSVMLTNQSNYRGVITADAVRFGGGMSNIERSDSTMTTTVRSGLPRFLEASRYTAMWSGIPYWVYSVKDNDDYGDDINTRPLSANYIARGSEYLPGDSGLCVPIEMSIALHSDAGCRRDSSFIGSLTVNTTDFNEGITGAGLNRLASRDLADMVLSQVTSDMTALYGKWNRRQMYNRNYGETREPHFPAIILEMFSHQNWMDMKYAHDPNFKFSLARAIYKGIGRYLHCVHRAEGNFVTQPLPVSDISAIVEEQSGRIHLNWRPTEDITDPTSVPTKYVVYTSIGDKGYDNGNVTDSPSFVIEAKDAALYRFRVAALNDGGCSMLSEEVCAYYAGVNAPRLLLVDGFQRLAGPAAINDSEMCGFDMSADPGVIDYRSPGFSGYQVNFQKKGFGREGPNGLGYSGRELEGMVLAGNTHDYSSRHARDILSAGMYNISSCVGSAFMYVRANHFQLIDIIFGAQKSDVSHLKPYKTFTPNMISSLQDYTRQGGNILVSGAFIGSDMQNDTERQFTEQTLKYRYSGSVIADSIPTTVHGANLRYSIYDSPNERNYWVRSMDVIEAVGDAYSTMLYDKSGNSAAILYKGDDYHVMAFGFPLECIADPDTRRQIISSSVQVLLSK